ncbi:MAG: nuclear transport factor 2 family protein [Candidatus Binataceae bacterium]
MSTDELVREVAAREAIRDLSARYCDCIWRNDLDGLMSFFIEDGSFVVEDLEVKAISRGRTQLRKVYEKAIAEMSPRLFIHSHIVDLLGENRATGRCYAEVYSATLACSGSAWATTRTSTQK